mgnify:CR=1 FL=1
MAATSPDSSMLCGSAVSCSGKRAMGLTGAPFIRGSTALKTVVSSLLWEVQPSIQPMSRS